MSLRKEVIDEVFFPGVFGQTIPSEVNESPQAINYYRKSLDWAEDYAGLVETEHRNVGIVAGQKDGIRGHFVQKVIVYLPPRKIKFSKT